MGRLQIFPENRSQAGELVFWAAGMAAAVTAFLFYMMRRERRRHAVQVARAVNVR